MSHQNGVALLLIDIQNDFIDGSLAVKEARQILPTVNSLISLSGWQMIIATKDSHPEKHISFASTHDLEPFQTIKIPHPTLSKANGKETGEEVPKVDQMLWPDHCLKGSSGFELEEGLQKALDEKMREGQVRVEVLEKGQSINHDAYSAFSYNHYLSFSDLPRILFSHPTSSNHQELPSTNLNSSRLKPISTIVLCGIATDYCLFSSAVDSVKFGFRTIVVLQGCRGVDVRGDGCSKEIQEMKDWGCEFWEVGEVEKLLRE